MIGKKVAKNHKRAAQKTKAANVRDLTSYIAEPQSEEKLLYANGRNFLADSLAAWQMEMVALAHEAVRSRDPVSHYILSWREGEQPTGDQAEAAVSILLEELGLEEHQTIYGLHRDTDNIHLHVAVNRVDPSTYRVIKPNKGFDIEATHKAVARIEHDQGWQSERNTRYRVLPDGTVARSTAEQEVPGERQPGQRSRDYEQRTGARSAERIAIEEAAFILREAATWRELHQRLEVIGIRFEQKGSGALLWVGQQPVKPSAVDRAASFGALQKRLGPYQQFNGGKDGNNHGGLERTPERLPEDNTEPDTGIRRDGGSTREGHGVHGVFERGVASNRDRAPVLLPGDVSDLLVEGAADRNTVVRRGHDRTGRVGDRIEAALPILRTASSWEMLHQQLSALGVRYERKGSGALLRVDNHVVKASAVDRTFSLGALQKRLGAFQTAPTQAREDNAAPSSRGATPLRASPPEWRAYMEARTAHYASKETGLVELRKGHDAERETLRVAQRARREEVLAAASNKALRQALRSVLAAEHAAAKAELSDRLSQERKAFRQQHPRFPDLEQWLRARNPAEADRWRYRASEPARIEGPEFVPPRPQDIRAFSASIHGSQVYYHHQQADAPASFVDRGRAIYVHDTYDRAAVLASLQLAAQKWGRFQISGDDSYKKLCTQLAAESAFQLDNPELQDALREERERIRGPRRHTPRPHADRRAVTLGGEGSSPRLVRPSPLPKIGSSPPPECRGQLRSIATDFHRPQEVSMPQSHPEAQPKIHEIATADASTTVSTASGPAAVPRGKGRVGEESHAPGVNQPDVRAAFDIYHAAVGAERYRVTAIKMTPDGQKKAFILDKKEGVSIGFTPDEIRSRTREMLRLEKRGENLYYTPLSESKHHILVDDMTREKLERLVGGGYKPAVVLESSPGNFQAVISIPKLGSSHDRDIGNRLSLELNREYGDPNLSGAIHPHRAPGYSNRKPKHVRPDGTYPEVKLLKAELRECERALARTREILAEREATAVRLRDHLTMSPAIPPSSQNTVAAYYDHYHDIFARLAGGEVNYSRLDSMIALRLRVTGHGAPAVVDTLERCSPTIRPSEKEGSHQWQEYAQRTVQFAFGPAGDQQLEKTQRYHEQWRHLETQHSTPSQTRPLPDMPDV